MIYTNVKIKKGKESNHAVITHVANSDSFADVSFLARYNFDSRFHTFAEA